MLPSSNNKWKVSVSPVVYYSILKALPDEPFLPAAALGVSMNNVVNKVDVVNNRVLHISEEQKRERNGESQGSNNAIQLSNPA